MADAALYSIRPTFKEKFPPAEVKKIIGTFLAEYLADKSCALAPPESHAPTLVSPPHPAISLPPAAPRLQIQPGADGAVDARDRRWHQEQHKAAAGVAAV